MGQAARSGPAFRFRGWSSMRAFLSKIVPIPLRTGIRQALSPWSVSQKRGEANKGDLFSFSGVADLDHEARRRLVANLYLTGDGVEIGALHSPLRVAPTARVKYIDRMTVEQLRIHYQELNDLPLVALDIIADGELLTEVPDETQDFVIANHFIEHCENPILACRNMIRVLKPGGVLYLAIPDKRYTFDSDRPVTPLAHLRQDFEQGPAWSRNGHFQEWARLVDKVSDDNDEAQKRADFLAGIDYSIHFHVWTQAEMFELITALRQDMGLSFDIELFLKNEIECIFILRKNPSN